MSIILLVIRLMIMVGCPSCTSDALSRNNHLNLNNHLFNLKPSISTSTSSSFLSSSSSNSRRGGGGGGGRRSSSSSFDSREALFLLLRRCTSFKQLKQIHAQIYRCGLSDDQFLLTQFLTTLCSSSSSFNNDNNNINNTNEETRRRRRMDYASLVFHEIRDPPESTFTWNLMIRSHTLNANPHQALLLYNLMIHRGIPPDNFTFPFVIKACLVSSAIHKGKEVHALLIKTAEFSHDIFVQNTLMDLYFKCGDPVYARQVFDKMRKRNVVSWTTMIGGLILCGELEAARAVFEVIPVRRNVVSWSAIINGYARNHQPEEAFQLFRRMQLDNVEPNEFTLVSLLVASTELGDVRLGAMVHEFANRKGFELGVFLGTALIDMYSKCGSVEDAIKVFDQMRDKSLATWNSMITSLGVHGRGDEALAVFAKMEQQQNVKPDAITFVGVLCACLQTDAVDEGCRYFRYMSERYGIVPITEHYVCMVEILGHAGMLDEAYELVKKIMPLKPNDDIWQVLLRASRAYDNAEIEEAVYKHIEDSTTRADVFSYFSIERSEIINHRKGFDNTPSSS